MTLSFEFRRAAIFVTFWAIMDRLRELPLFWTHETWIGWPWMLTTNGPHAWLWVFQDGYHFFKWLPVLVFCMIFTPWDDQWGKNVFRLMALWMLWQIFGQLFVTFEFAQNWYF